MNKDKEALLRQALHAVTLGLRPHEDDCKRKR